MFHDIRIVNFFTAGEGWLPHNLKLATHLGCQGDYCDCSKTATDHRANPDLR